eukprot:403360949
MEQSTNSNVQASAAIDLNDIENSHNQNTQACQDSKKCETPTGTSTLPWYKRLMRLFFYYAFNPFMIGIFAGTGYLTGSIIFKFFWAHSMEWYKQKK